MKRLKNAWESIISQANITEAVYAAIEHKHNDPLVKRKLLYTAEESAAHHGAVVNPQKVEAYAEMLRNRLASGEYIHKKPMYKHMFCMSQSKGYVNGKWRDIYCPSLIDHVVHHAVIQAIRPALQRGMVEQCCGSVPGRGQKTVRKFVEKWVRSDPESKFFVKLDIRHFFDSIPKERLIEQLRKVVGDPKAMQLICQILYSSPSACPVGYYTSPWLSNYYLQGYDHFIAQDLYKIRCGKRINYVRHFVRYADDILLIGSSKRDLEKAVRASIEYLSGLGLEVKTCWEIKRIAEYDGNGKLKPGTYRIDICGYVFDREKTILRSGIYLSTMRLARKIHKRYQRTGGMRLYHCQAMNSKIAWAEQADCAGTIAEIDRLVDIKEIRTVISNAAKCGIFREAGANAL